MTTKFTGSLRLIMAVGVMLAIIIPGYLNRSAWIILLATPAFVVIYALGKLAAWKLAWRLGGLKSILLAILTTLPIQLILVAVLYLIGLGASMLVGASTGIQPLTSTDIVTAAILFLFALAVSTLINVIEAKAEGDAPDPIKPQESVSLLKDEQQPMPNEDLELDIDPRPLTPQNFYLSRGYWKCDALYDALEGRGQPVAKKPEAAGEEAISTAEARLGFKLPAGLRDLYKVLDGGYVGEMYVPLQAKPGPVYEDWRGAFSIDYSSLVSLDKLGTVKEHYEAFTDDPDEMPAHADRMVVLQARYQDMTLLDYSDGPEPRVRLVDFDDYADRSTDVEFPDFDSFFQALRRPHEEKRISGDRLLASRKKPVSEYMPAQQPSEFWRSDVHVFTNIAKSRDDGSEPKQKADDDLIAETELRLGVILPPVLADFWRHRNGGALSAQHFQISRDGEPYEEVELPEQLMPMEYFATLAEVSDRISYPDGEVPLRDRHQGAERLVILQAKDREALLLDYRGNAAEPAVLIVNDIESKGLASATRVDSVTRLLQGLRAWKSSR